MATERREVITRYSIDASRALKGLRDISRSSARTATILQNMERSISRLGVAFGTLGAGFIVQQVIEFSAAIIRASDSVAMLSLQMEGLGGGAEGFERLYEAAQRLGIPMQNLGETLNFLVPGLQRLGVGFEESVGFAEDLTQSMRLFGVQGEQASSILLQLGQALSSGVFSGDELKSFRENAAGLSIEFEEAAQSVLGVNDSLKDLGEQQVLTAEVTQQAFSQVFERLRGRFEELPQTLEQQQARFANAATLLGDAVNDAFRLDEGATSFFDTASTLLEELAIDVRTFAEETDVIGTSFAVIGNTVEGLFGIFQALGSVIADIGSGLFDVLGQLGGLLTEPSEDVINFGDLFGYTFEVLIPTAIQGFQSAITVAFETFRNSASVTVNAVLTFFQKIPPSVGLAFATASDAARAALQTMINSTITAVQNIINTFLDGVNSLLSGLNNLPGLDIGQIGAVDLSGWQVQLEGASEAAAGYRAELAALDAQSAAFNATVKEQQDALIAQQAALIQNTQLRAEEARIQRRTGEEAEKTVNITKEQVAQTNNLAKALGGGGAGGGGGAAGAANRAAKELERYNKVLRDGTGAIDEYLQKLNEEIELAGLSDKARAARKVELDLEGRARRELAKAAEAEARGMNQVADAHRQVAQQWRESIPEAQRLTAELNNIKDAGRGLADSLNIEGALSDLFEGFIGGEGGVDDFLETTKDKFLRTFSDIAAQIASTPINLVINAVLGNVAGGTGGGLGDIGKTITSAFDTGSKSFANTLSEGVSNVASKFGFEKLSSTITTNSLQLSNLASTLSGGLGVFSGTFLGTTLFGDDQITQLGSTIGSTAGSALGIALAPVLGPLAFLGPALGGILGGIGGGFLGSLFGSGTEPYAQFATRGGEIRGAGGAKLDPELYREMEAYIGRINDATRSIAEVLGEEAQAARESFQAISPELDPNEIQGYLTDQAGAIIRSILDAVPGAFGDMLRDVTANLGNDIDAVIVAMDGLIAQVQQFGVVVELIDPNAFDTFEDAAEAFAVLGERAPEVTQNLASLAQFMGSLTTEEERMAQATERVNEVFAEANLTVPGSTAALEDLVGQLDLTTSDGLLAADAIGSVTEELALIYDAGNLANTSISAFYQSLVATTTTADDVTQKTAEMEAVFAEMGSTLPNSREQLLEWINAGKFTEEQLQRMTDSALDLGAALDDLSSSTLTNEEFIRSITPQEVLDQSIIDNFMLQLEAVGLELPKTSEALYELYLAGELTEEQIAVLARNVEGLGLVFGEAGKEAETAVQRTSQPSTVISSSAAPVDPVLNFVESLRTTASDGARDFRRMVDLFERWGLQMPQTTDALLDMYNTGEITKDQMRVLAESQDIFNSAIQYYGQTLETLTEAVENLQPGAAAEAIDLLGGSMQNMEATAESLQNLFGVIGSRRVEAVDPDAAFASITDILGDIPDNADDLIAIIDALDLTTQSGLDTAVALGDVSAELKVVIDTLDTTTVGFTRAGDSVRYLNTELEQFSDVVNNIQPNTLESLATTAERLAQLGIVDLPEATATMQDFAQVLNQFAEITPDAAEATRVVTEAFEEMGVIVPESVNDFALLLQSIDLSTDAGLNMALVLGSLNEEIGIWANQLDQGSISLEGYANALISVNEMLDATRQDIFEFGMSPEQIYNLRREEADRVMEQLATLTDPTQIENAISRVNELISQGWGQLDDQQRSAMREPFLQYIDDITALAEERLAIGAAEAVEEAPNLETTLVDFATMMERLTQEQNVSSEGLVLASSTMAQSVELFTQSVLNFSQKVNEMPEDVQVTEQKANIR